MAALSSSLVATSLALALIDATGLSSWPLLGSLLVLANAVAALFRFVVLRAWMFRTATNPSTSETPTLVPEPVTFTERQTG
jgi:hypothetical protein